MANLNGMNDPTGGERSQGIGPMEPGEYTLALVKSDMVESKNSPGNYYLACEFQNEGGVGRVWVNFNLVNANATAQEIAWRDFNALKHACGKLNVEDSEELHGIPFTARVAYDRRKENGAYVEDRERNRITAYKPLNSVPAMAKSAPASNAGAARKPWQKAN